MKKRASVSRLTKCSFLKDSDSDSVMWWRSLLFFFRSWISVYWCKLFIKPVCSFPKSPLEGGVARPGGVWGEGAVERPDSKDSLSEATARHTLSSGSGVCTCAHTHTHTHTHSTKLPLIQHKILIILFFLCAVCLDLPPPAAVWAVSQGAAPCGPVTATGGEVHPGKKSGCTGRHAGTTGWTVVMPTWCWHRELTSDCCCGLQVALRSKVIGWMGMMDSPVWFRMCWKSVFAVIMFPSKTARLSSTQSSELGKGQRQCTEHLQDKL